jgi:hypothetical protein
MSTTLWKTRQASTTTKKATRDLNTRGKGSKGNHKDIVLVPEPTDDPDDPLVSPIATGHIIHDIDDGAQNWPLRKKILIFASIAFAAFAGQMSPNSNQLTFTEQIPVYHKTVADLLNSVAASLAGWVAGPYLIVPTCGVIGRSSVVFWSLAGIFACQVWGAKMTGADDYIPFVLSRLFAGFFAAVPAILGSGYVIDLFYLHQRGKAFAVFEVLVILAVIGGATLSGFIAEANPWNDVFWWTLGPIGAAMVCVILFVEDTSFDRTAGVTQRRQTLPRPWLANRVATFLPGTRTQPPGKLRAMVSLQVALA